MMNSFNDQATKRVTDLMNVRRALMERQVKSDQIQAECCGVALAMKEDFARSGIDINEQINAAPIALRTYIQFIELFRGAIYCEKCTQARVVPVFNPATQSPVSQTKDLPHPRCADMPQSGIKDLPLSHNDRHLNPELYTFSATGTAQQTAKNDDNEMLEDKVPEEWQQYLKKMEESEYLEDIDENMLFPADEMNAKAPIDQYEELIEKVKRALL